MKLYSNCAIRALMFIYASFEVELGESDNLLLLV
jgi:hypothetical protein